MTTLRKVLVVDDDPVVAKSFDRVLSNKGYAVITASNGEEALRKIASEDYDVVYTDIRMPGMDGIEVAEHIKDRRPWLPVVIVTGFGTAENEARAKAAGVTAVLHKPLSPAMIEGSARDALAAALLPEEAETAALLATPPAQPESKPASAAQFAKNVALFLAAPFIGLMYILLFPLIGLGMLAGSALKRAGVRGESVKAALKTAGMIAIAPLMGLVYTVALPFVALGLLCWIGGKHLFTGK
jgi:CheY-like chemotaxis protein